MLLHVHTELNQCFFVIFSNSKIEFAHNARDTSKASRFRIYKEPVAQTANSYFCGSAEPQMELFD